MFGGNPGGKQGKEDKLRLGDFWLLTLFRPSREEVLRRCLIAIRTAQFSEATRRNKMEALALLQGRLSKVVNHADDKEERQASASTITFCPLINTNTIRTVLSSSFWRPSSSSQTSRSLLLLPLTGC